MERLKMMQTQQEILKKQIQEKANSQKSWIEKQLIEIAKQQELNK